jgi:hypothetical protein
MISLRHVLIALLPQDSQQSAINRIASQLVDTTLNDAATDSRLITPGGIFLLPKVRIPTGINTLHRLLLPELC